MLRTKQYKDMAAILLALTVGVWALGGGAAAAATNLADFAVMAQGWLDETTVPEVAGVAPEGPPEVTLIAGGMPYAVIVTTAAGTPSHQAAVFLRDKLAAMTGVNLQIWQYTFPQLPPTQIVVGPQAAAAAGVTVSQDYPGLEAHVIRRVGNKVVLAGNDGGQFRGTWHAVMGWLTELGWRKYRYDDDNYEIIPALDSVIVGALDIEDAPVFEHRRQWAACDTACTQKDIWWDWLGLGGLNVRYGHTEFISTSECNTNPEFFSWNGSAWVPCEASGEWQYNTSHPGVVSRAVDAAAASFANDINRSYSLGPRDTGGYSQDPCSLAEVAPYNNKASARFALLANKVQAEIDQRYPEYSDRYLVFYAFWHTKWAPGPDLYLAERVSPMVVGDSDHVHLMEDPSNATFRSAFTGWLNISTTPPGIYEWYIPAYPFNGTSRWENFPWIAIRKPILDLRYLRSKGIRWIYFETAHRQRYCPYRWVTYYMAARAQWNPDQNPLHLLRELCQDLYGSAWKSLYDYYNLLDLTMLNSPHTAGTWGLPAPGLIFSAEVRAQADALLAQAVSEAAGDPPAVRSRVQDAVDAWNLGWASQP